MHLPYDRTMLRKLMFLLVFLAAFGRAVAGDLLPRIGFEELVHASTHEQQESHHHHADGSLHLDEAGDRGAHVHVEPFHTVALLIEQPSQFDLGASQGTPVSATPFMPSPAIDGLLRPPQFAF